MKKEDFLSIMDGIDDRLVEQHQIRKTAGEKQKRRSVWLDRAASCAAAAVIFALIGLGMLFGAVRSLGRETASVSGPAALTDQTVIQEKTEAETDSVSDLIVSEEVQTTNEIVTTDAALKSYFESLEVDADTIQKQQRLPEVLFISGVTEQAVETGLEAYTAHSTDGSELQTVISMVFPEEVKDCSRIDITDTWRQYLLPSARGQLYTRTADTQEWSLVREIYPFANGTYQIVLPETEITQKQAESRMIISFPVPANGRGLNLKGYQIRIHLDETAEQNWLPVLWFLGAAAAMMAALWFLNRYFGLKRLKETGRRAGRFLFGRATEYGARVISIESADLFNPSQYLTRNGVVSPGSSGRCHVSFELEDDTILMISVSAKQAGTFEPGMRGTLVHRRDILLSFVPEGMKKPKKRFRWLIGGSIAALVLAGVPAAEYLLRPRLAQLEVNGGNTVEEYGKVFLQSKELLAQSGLLFEPSGGITKQDTAFCSNGVKQVGEDLWIIRCYGVTNGGIYVTVYSRNELYQIEDGAYSWSCEIGCPDAKDNPYVTKTTHKLPEMAYHGYIAETVIPAPTEMGDDTLTLRVTEDGGQTVREITLKVDTILLEELAEKYNISLGF